MGISKFLKQFDKNQPRIINPRVVVVPQQYTKEQNMMDEFFGGNPDNCSLASGTGRSLPKINRILISGGGLVKNGDNGETSSMFGFNRKLNWRHNPMNEGK